jgi:hypothetical protein
MEAGTVRVELSSPERIGGSERGARGACRRFRFAIGRGYLRPADRPVAGSWLSAGTG